MLDENASNARRSSRTSGKGKPRDSNPYGALSENSDGEQSRRSSLAASSRRSSRLSTDSGVDLMSMVEDQTVFVHPDLAQFDESRTASEAGAGGVAPKADARRKTVDGAAVGGKASSQAQQNARRNTFAASASSAGTADLLDLGSLLDATTTTTADDSSNKILKRSWSNQSPTASTMSFERSSDRKRVGARSKSPSTRRMTVDPDDLAALMNEFDNDVSSSKTSISIQDITSSILAGSSSAGRH